MGHSYHLMITALVSGVPVFTQQNMSAGKYVALREFDRIFDLPGDQAPTVDWFLDRIGRKQSCSAARFAYDRAGEHWDRITEAPRSEGLPTAPTLNRFWQSMRLCWRMRK